MIEPVDISRHVGHLDPGTGSTGPVEIINAPLLGTEGEPTSHGFLVLESYHSTWLFDTDNHRFRRVLKGSLGDAAVSTEWRAYHRLVLHPDSDAFVVFLDASGTRLLRSWRHTAHCDQCGGDASGGMSLEDLRRVARA